VKGRFGSFTIDTEARRLTRGQTDVHLSPKAFDLLTLLLERRPSVVDKADLRKVLWPGVHVVDASLSNLVTEIRGALDGDQPGTSAVRTVHGVGYAFGGDLTALGPAPRGEQPRVASCWLVWKERALPLIVGDNVIGRDGSCAVWIDAGGVSRRHACLRVPAEDSSETVTVEDLGSTNGTYVQGRRVRGVESVQHGARLRLGDATLVFRARASEAATRRIRRDP